MCVFYTCACSTVFYSCWNFSYSVSDLLVVLVFSLSIMGSQPNTPTMRPVNLLICSFPWSTFVMHTMVHMPTSSFPDDDSLPAMYLVTSSLPPHLNNSLWPSLSFSLLQRLQGIHVEAPLLVFCSPSDHPISSVTLGWGENVLSYVLLLWCLCTGHLSCIPLMIVRWTYLHMNIYWSG